jgi:hypothetical protein
MLKTLFLVLICFPVNTKAGWLLWEAPAYIPPPAGEKELRSVQAALPFIPPTARLDGNPAVELKLDAIFEAGAGELRDFLGAAGFEETSYGFKSSFFAALTQLFSARLPTRFPPAPKWLAPHFVPENDDLGRGSTLSAKSSGSQSAGLAAGRPQDLSFIRLQAGDRTGVYLWRLPYRTKKAPLWAAGARSPGGKTVWDGMAERTKKGRALELKARPAVGGTAMRCPPVGKFCGRGSRKTCLVFTLP